MTWEKIKSREYTQGFNDGVSMCFDTLYLLQDDLKYHGRTRNFKEYRKCFDFIMKNRVVIREKYPEVIVRCNNATKSGYEVFDTCNRVVLSRGE